MGFLNCFFKLFGESALLHCGSNENSLVQKKETHMPLYEDSLQFTKVHEGMGFDRGCLRYGMPECMTPSTIIWPGKFLSNYEAGSSLIPKIPSLEAII